MSTNPNRPSKALRKQLMEQVGRARKVELTAALGELAGQFDRWRAGELDVDDLDQAVHRYHNGTARLIWRRYEDADRDPELLVARAVVRGLIARESLSPEILAQIAPILDFIVSQMADEE